MLRSDSDGYTQPYSAMPLLIGYARISEWEERLLDEDPEDARSRFGIQSIAEQVAAILSQSWDVHPELPTDTAPSGIRPLTGDASGPAVDRPGLTRVRELLNERPGSVLVVTDLDRVALRVREVEWLLEAHPRQRPGALGEPPPIVALNSWLSTMPGEDPSRAHDFLQGAAAERRARRARVALSARPSAGSSSRSPAFVYGARWEAYAPPRRARDADEERRLGGRAAGRPSVTDDAALARRVRGMRASGMSYGAIARELNAECVPTLRGGRLWRASSLQRTLQDVGARTTETRFGTDSDALHALFPEGD